MTKILPACDVSLSGRRMYGLFDDFFHYTADDRWALETAVDGTASTSDAAGGTVSIASAVATAGNEDAYLASVREVFKFAANKPLSFEALVRFTEAATNKANILVGLMDAVATDALQDDGAGPKASYSGAVFYKVANETVWRCESSIGASQETTTTEKTAGGASAQRLRIDFQPLTSTQGEVRFFFDDELVAKHAITFTSATEMQVVLGVKDGAVASVETLTVDYVECWQLR